MKIKIARGKNRFEKFWKNSEIEWSDLVKELSETTRTRETFGEFMNMKKSEQDNIKDVGGFVCGYLENGKRGTTSVKSRSVVTLDGDFAPTNFLDIVELSYGGIEYCIYSTHKHTPEKPRLRVLFPLNRDVTPEEYEAIARKIAHDIGIDYFDDTTYQASRLMYYPSTSKDGEYIFYHGEGEILNADDILKSYTNWQDVSTWYTSSRTDKCIQKTKKKQENPREKKGIIGAFCRCYDIPSAIDRFLSDIYEPCTNGRYTYKNGSTSGGLVLYENGDFAYSNHATDIANGQLCNAFDLVRLHKFHDLDEDAEPNTPVSKLPSYLKMCEFAQNDSEIKTLILKEKSKEIEQDFKNLPISQDIPQVDDNLEILNRLTRNSKTGDCENTIDNVKLILQGDKQYRGRVALDEFAGRIKLDRKSNWTDKDDSFLRWYLEKKYGITKRTAIDDGLMIIATENKYHPVQNYFNSLKWDGNPRIDEFFINFLGCKDNSYTRAVTRTMFLSLVARIFQNGCKVDTMVVLVGEQGIGKSTILRKLLPNEDWFSDSLTNIQSKDAYEQLLEKSLIEIGELSAMKKSDVENTKLFISKQSDNYRKAYGHHAENVKRQCIFVGTTNTQAFLKDSTGNRRFYPLDCRKSHITMSIWQNFDENYRNQLWAEAVESFKNGEKWYIEDKSILNKATEIQNAHFDESPLQADIENYLNTLLPENWNSLDLNQRRTFLHGGDFATVSNAVGTIKRDTVCIKEIWCECFNHELTEKITRGDQLDISNVLTRLGWKTQDKKARTHLYGVQRVYVADN
jgi:predicted P-loop ATPase